MKRVNYVRPVLTTVVSRLSERRRFIQVLAGPRQAGKTTLARQALDRLGLPSHYASADQATGQSPAWLEAQWEIARDLASGAGKRKAVLVLDEVQKITNWSEIVKRLWDEDTAQRRGLRVALLGSAPLLVQHGLSESLAGRFELIRVGHWSFQEMRDAFGFDLNRYVFYGGYPAAASLISDHDRWAAYVLDSLVETTLSRDILLLSRIEKPALLRQLFRLGCDYSAQILSYTKMLGQLQEAGNTVTLAHYLELLAGAGLVTGLRKYSGSKVRQRGSIPKLVALNTGLVSAVSGLRFGEARRDREFWGRLVETAAGAHLVNTSGPGTEVFYWRERNREVDFVARSGRKLMAMEVKSGRSRDSTSGLSAFDDEFGPIRKLLVGAQGMALDDFLTSDVSTLMR